MHSVSDALSIVLSLSRPLPARAQRLSDALGQSLAEDVHSDIDMPPFDRAVMDGFAVRHADFANGAAELDVVEEITAGQVPRFAVESGQCSRIMTGAPLPVGVDTVVMVERARMLSPNRVRLEETPKVGQHILRRGAEVRTGECVVSAGSVLRPQELGMLAMLGRAEAQVYPRPRVAVAATGDELVEPPGVPGPGQIRNSNAPMLLAQSARAGATTQYLGIGRDSRASLTAVIERGLREADVLVLSGGVSAGTHDLVPVILAEVGIVAHLHKVRLKPGKPFFFGTRGSILIFGLPGNPVSSLVCFELFIRPALRRLAGLPDESPLRRLRLSEAVSHKSDRPTYHPARIESDTVRAVRWGGSSDLRAFLNADALLVLPEGEARFEAGAMVEVISLR